MNTNINLELQANLQRFSMTKKHHTATLNKAIAEGVADEMLIDFLLKVANISSIYTSSSCAGRIILLSTDEFENKKYSDFVDRYHRKITFDELKKAITDYKGGDLWFKVEPFIFHFGTANIETAKNILDMSRDFGLKKSGIITAKEGRYVLEINSTQYISVPVKINNELIVNDKFLKLLVDRANKKLDVNYKRLERYMTMFLSIFATPKDK